MRRKKYKSLVILIYFIYQNLKIYSNSLSYEYFFK